LRIIGSLLQIRFWSLEKGRNVIHHQETSECFGCAIKLQQNVEQDIDPLTTAMV